MPLYSPVNPSCFIIFWKSPTIESAFAPVTKKCFQLLQRDIKLEKYVLVFFNQQVINYQTFFLSTNGGTQKWPKLANFSLVL